MSFLLTPPFSNSTPKWLNYGQNKILPWTFIVACGSRINDVVQDISKLIHRNFRHEIRICMGYRVGLEKPAPKQYPPTQTNFKGARGDADGMKVGTH